MLLLKLSVLLAFFAIQVGACKDLFSIIFTFISHQIGNIGLEVSAEPYPSVRFIISILSCNVTEVILKDGRLESVLFLSIFIKWALEVAQPLPSFILFLSLFILFLMVIFNIFESSKAMAF